MERHLIRNFGANADMVRFGVAWLAERDGGIIISPQKRNLEHVFGIRTAKEYASLERRLAELGIALQTARGGFHVAGRATFALYPTEKLLEEIESRGKPSALMVLGWTPSETDAWEKRHSPELIEGGFSMPDWARELEGRIQAAREME